MAIALEQVAVDEGQQTGTISKYYVEKRKKKKGWLARPYKT